MESCGSCHSIQSFATQLNFHECQLVTAAVAGKAIFHCTVCTVHNVHSVHCAQCALCQCALHMYQMLRPVSAPAIKWQSTDRI